MSKVKTLKVSDETTEQIKGASQFVEEAVQPARLQQGFDFLREMCFEASMKNIQWVIGDVIKEEGDVLIENNMQEKTVKKLIASKAKDYYMKHMNQ